MNTWLQSLPRRLLAPLGLAALLVGCASTPSPDAEAEGRALQASEWAQASQPLPDGAWTHQRYGQRKATDYTPQRHQGRPSVRADSHAGNSTLRLRVPGQAVTEGKRVAFSWYVPALLPAADLADKDNDDAVVRTILTFDGDRSRLSRRDHLFSELVQLVTGEPLPFATLMYVWDAKLPVGSVVPSPHTPRIRKLVIESGPERLGRWIDYERDIATDFRQVFGEDPGPLTGLGVMTDTNNTGSRARVWFGPLRLLAGR